MKAACRRCAAAAFTTTAPTRPTASYSPATALASFPGPYALEALDVSIDVVLTNLVPTSPVRGAARPCTAFVLERLADRIARHLDLPREEVRRRSFSRDRADALHDRHESARRLADLL